MLDWEKAFDKISHSSLIKTLTRFGIPDKLVRLVSGIYKAPQFSVSINGKTSDPQTQECGIRQGCPLSPILFACVIDGLLRKIKQASPTSTVRAFADDIGMVVDDFGADAEKVMSIFDRFYRVENAVHTEVGTGLGLSIVSGILDKQRAQVFMVSELDVGTTFWFELPLEQADLDELALQAERRSISELSDEELIA